jgi:phage terminase large subunit-like protein
MANPYFIDEFQPDTAQRDRIWLLIGGRNSGKTVLLKDLLYRTQRHTCDLCLGMTATVSTANMFKTIMPPDFVYSKGYSYAIADAYRNRIRW